MLALSEVPAGFNTAFPPGHYLSLASLAKQTGVTVARYRTWGYDNGYEVDFATETGAAGFGTSPLGISSIAIVYQTAAGVKAAYRSAYRQCSKLGGEYVSAGRRIGDQSFVCAIGSVNLTTPDDDLYWRQGTVEGVIILAGQSQRAVSVKHAAALAQKQDAKDKAVLRG